MHAVAREGLGPTKDTGFPNASVRKQLVPVNDAVTFDKKKIRNKTLPAIP